VVAILASLHSCTKKVSGIDNNQVIETPFSLFFSDTAGALYSSNDGKTIRSTLFHADGYPSYAICVANNNLLWGKNALFLSGNNGVNFNHAFDSFGHYPGVACNGFPINVNQSMMIDIPDWNRVYTVSFEPWAGNYLGLRFSLSSGQQGTWWTEGRPDTEGNCGNYGDEPYTITMTSLTMLKNGVLCGYDGMHNREFYKTEPFLWKETTANPDSINHPGAGIPGRYSGSPLPHCDVFSGSFDTTARYSYGHYNNRLIAIDLKNCAANGAYYSDDTGKNWFHYSGLPNKPLLCIASPFEETCLIGTAGAGLYILNTNTGVWQQCNNGLGSNLIVRNIAFHKNVYKDASVKKYIFLATNQGIYTSTDNGLNWTLTLPGNFVNIY
jgi:hypothetical protein